MGTATRGDFRGSAATTFVFQRCSWRETLSARRCVIAAAAVPTLPIPFGNAALSASGANALMVAPASSPPPDLAIQSKCRVIIVFAHAPRVNASMPRYGLMRNRKRLTYLTPRQVVSISVYDARPDAAIFTDGRSALVIHAVAGS